MTFPKATLGANRWRAGRVGVRLRLSARVFGLLGILFVTSAGGWGQEEPPEPKPKVEAEVEAEEVKEAEPRDPSDEIEENRTPVMPPRVAPAVAMTGIVRREDERAFVAAEFESWFRHDSPDVRERAALAAGRIGDPGAGPGLLALLSDEVAVAQAAAFGLGLLGDASSVEELKASLAREEEALRVSLLDALGRIGGAPAHDAILPWLNASDSPKSVRESAAVALSRKPRKETVPDLFAALKDREPDVRWRAAYALSRLKWKGGHEGLVQLVEEEEEPLGRLFAVRALRGQPEEVVTDTMIEAAGDADWRVAVEAIRGLAELGSPEAVRRMTELSGHASFHVRAEVQLGLGKVDLDHLNFPKDERVLAKASVIVGLRDPSSAVAAAAIRTYGKVFRQYAMRRLPELLRSPDPLRRAAAVEALSETGRNEVFALLKTRFQEDPDFRVRESVLRAVSKIALPPARSLLLSGLESDDFALVAAAAEFLGARNEKRAERPLQTAFSRSSGWELAEARAAVLKALARVGSGETEAVLRKGLEDSDAMVRIAAREALVEFLKKENSGEAEIPEAAVLARVTPAPQTSLVEVESSWTAGKRRPRVRIETTRGKVVFELFPSEAPLHVAGFLERVEAEFYDGLRIHRVVPNWVVQGGDPRGDGWGSGGLRMRDQVTARRFVQGSIGVPTSGKDTAGCQFFITHLPTPRLEGAYTQIGRVIQGMEVVDRLEIDDEIRSMKVMKP